MERLKKLDLFRKIIVIVAAVMILVFSIIYPVTTSRKGFAFKNTILVPSYNGNTATYSGKLNGIKTEFTVIKGESVNFIYGDKVMGPFTVKENPDAIPEGLRDGNSSRLKGIDIYCGNSLYFSGTVLGKRMVLDSYKYPESNSYTHANNSNGPVSILVRPAAEDILELLEGPDIVHKGDPFFLFIGIIVSVSTILSVLYEEELFRWNLSFTIRNAEDAKPSEWYETSRRISWIVLVGLSMILFVTGLSM